MDDFKRHLTGNLTALAASLWAELGAGRSPRRHKNCAVDPEALIVFTSFLAKDSPDLCKLNLDWCVQHAAYISAWRLGRLRAQARHSVQNAFDRFATAVRAHGVARWPGDRTQPPVCGSAAGIKFPLRLDRPALVSLRLRELFGTGAPSEVLLALLGSPDGERSLPEISRFTGYSERNINEVLRGRNLRVFFERITRNGQTRYRLLYRTDLELLLRVLPERFPPWLKIFSVLAALRKVARAVHKSDSEILHHQVLGAVRRLGPDLLRLQQPLPRTRSKNDSFWRSFTDWSIRFTAECALGSSVVFGPVLATKPSIQTAWSRTGGDAAGKAARRRIRRNPESFLRNLSTNRPC